MSIELIALAIGLGFILAVSVFPLLEWAANKIWDFWDKILK